MTDRSKQFSELPLIDFDQDYTIDLKTTGIRLVVEWSGNHGELCDLDLCALIYDEKARFIEKITIDKPVSTDSSVQLEADTDNHFQSHAHSENIHIDLNSVDDQSSCIFLSLDGGSRNFKLVQRVSVFCSKENVERVDSDFMSHIESGGYVSTPLFQCIHKSPHFPKMEGMTVCCVYRDVPKSAGAVKTWHVKNVCEGIMSETTGEKDERCLQVALASVPAFSRYQPRLFPNVKVICSALSSTALPNLKTNFQDGEGLDIQTFTEVLFKQLMQSHPGLNDVNEAAYTVAMLQEMFSQIDFNGDGTVDWDEFTTFCIHTGLVTASENSGDGDAGHSTLENYTIEYAMDHNIKDSTLSSHTPLTQLRYSHEAKRLMAMKEAVDGVIMFNESFQQQALLNPNALPHADPHDKVKIHDICYLPGKDLYAYCGSDHTIVFVREHWSRKSKGMYYTVVNTIHTVHLHIKLCWSEKSETLCSVGADNMIYGWKVDTKLPTFHISRHKDLVTDFIAVDELDLFITCALDKRIVMWSQSSHRVKGILMGHTRGVRTMSYARGVLLSAGFECEARTWDVNLKECTLILRGHRMPIAAAKIMCPASDTGDDVRAITVDDSGEFRLWSVFVKEKSSEQGLAQVLQIFHIHTDEPAVAQARFIELPFTKQYARGNYSNLVAGSTKLVHLIPEKNTAEFIPPTCMCYNEPNGCVVTAVGKSLYKYDICSGEFISSLSNVDTSEISCMRLDGGFARRLYVGCASGRLLLLNFLTGDVLQNVHAHSKEIMCVESFQKGRKWVFTGGLDGKIRCLEEVNGVLTIHITMENAIGDGKGIASIKAAESLKVIVAASSGLYWGVWNTTVFKRTFLISESCAIVNLEVVAASGDKKEIDDNIYHGIPMENVHMLTIAVCTRRYVKVYALDTQNGTIANTHYFQPEDKFDITCFSILHFPKTGSVNYNSEFNAEEAPSDVFIAGSYEGAFMYWDASNVRQAASSAYWKLASKFYPGHHHSSMTRKQLDRKTSSFMDSIVYSDEESPRSNADKLDSGERNGVVDLSSMGSTLDSMLLTSVTSSGAVDPNLSGEQSNQDDASSVFSLTNSTVEYIGTAPRKSRRFELIKSETIVDIVTNNRDVNCDHLVRVMSAMNSWIVHSDAVSDLVSLNEHGCLVTVSIDGFHRMWNLDSNCLGEMNLPNITDSMKSRSLFRKERTSWKFIMERIPVSVSHIDIAQKLLLAIRRPQTSRELGRRNHANGGRAGGLLISDGDDMLMLKRARGDSLMIPQDNSGLHYKSPKDRVRMNLLREMRKQDSVNICDDDVSLQSLMEGSVGSSSIASFKSIPPLTPGSERAQTASTTKSSRGLDMQSVGSLRSLSSTKSGRSLWSSTHEICPYSNPAFSEHSIAAGHHEGILDAEGHKILRRVNHNEDRKDVYDRSTAKILLRNTAMSTKVEVPKLSSIELAEVQFGAQKHLYKHANKAYASKRNISTTQAQHAVTLSRIRQNMRKTGSMINVLDPPEHEVALPAVKVGSAESDENIKEDSFKFQPVPSPRNARRDRLLMEMKGPNVDKIKQAINRVHTAETTGIPEWETIQMEKYTKTKKRTEGRRSSTVHKTVALFEKKLAAAIRVVFSDDMNKTENKIVLTTRILLPYYKLSDVKHFLEIFRKVDEDYSGDLDAEEWCNFFTAMNASVTRQQARAIFNRVDVHGQGFLSFRELIPVIFNNATKDVQRLILKYTESEMSKWKAYGKNILTEADLQSLFKYYDENDLGFILVDTLRERIRLLQLPQQVCFAILEMLKDMEADEMVNSFEFVRIFRPYIVE